MTPIRVADLGVEPVSLSEMRGYLRLDGDEHGEDALIEGLVAAARASVEAATRRFVRPARFRLMLTAWPSDGVVPLPLSPLVAVTRVGLVGADGIVAEIDTALLRPGPDPWEAPCLLVDPGVPLLMRKAALIEVTTGCGGDGPPVPAPLAQAIRMIVADWFENRGDGVPAGLLASPPAVAGLLAPHRLMRL
ncbi:head-tail connector protein [Methylobacterium haplocladii]|uniref:PhiE125 gp8 family phage protein n=1 Tax=Methylobacterium haplocladii TaxID=1176176 RepID=A0A512IKX3_9HYPH|nr:head-tail connector protein [Methylobacterium haplocladii]GEO98325.1 hypothetical protein MHA02_07130 [Methylobacterium haplocladii]GJD82953.1 hypothetical protein HPGCJGGD_0815 [Methylobacterium haplocladii]GLS58718.1 hypothetical protein GCM10007887_13830 [Methylobacterium haplocladii]